MSGLNSLTIDGSFNLLLFNLFVCRSGRKSALEFFKLELNKGWIFLTLEKDKEGFGFGVADWGIDIEGVSTEKLCLESTGAEGNGSK